MRLRIALLVTLIAVVAAPVSAQRGLDIYFVDTEGGAATLIVTPAGESVLIDSGNPGNRDAERIHKVATQVAGLKQIDHIIATHWHLDHYGGHGHLAELMPVKSFYDHGIPSQSIDDPGHFPELIAAYKKACGDKSTTLKPGDTIPLKQAGPKVEILTLVGMQSTIPDKPGAPANPIAKENAPQPVDPSDNANSLGFLLKFGDWKFLDLGDLTWNIEYKLIAPSNKIGFIDVYQTTHHGLNVSNNPVLIKSVRPVVAIFNNGPHKGANIEVLKTLRDARSIEAIYQQHQNLDIAASDNEAADFIANPGDNCKAEFIKVSVAPDAKSYTVQIGRNGRAKTFQTRRSSK